MNISYNFYVKKNFYACYVKNVILPIDILRNERNKLGVKNIGNNTKFKLNIYTNVDDYNKVVLSKRQTKRIIKRGGLLPSYSGETMTFSLWFPRSYLQRYNKSCFKLYSFFKEWIKYC